MKEAAKAEGRVSLQALMPRKKGGHGCSRNPLLQVLWVQNKDFDLFPKCHGTLLRNFQQGKIRVTSAF